MFFSSKELSIYGGSKYLIRPKFQQNDHVNTSVNTVDSLVHMDGEIENLTDWAMLDELLSSFGKFQ